MNSSKKTGFYNLLCIFLALSVIGIRVIDNSRITSYSVQAVIYLLYTSAILICITQVKRRLINKEERRYLIMVGGLSIMLILLRTIKYMFIPVEHITHRYTWYLYYFPQIFSVLFMFFAVLHIGKPYNYSINKKWKLLYIPCTLLFLAVLTNDFHEKAFSFGGRVYCYFKMCSFGK